MNLYSITLNDAYQRHQLQDAEKRRANHLAEKQYGLYGIVKRTVNRQWQKSNQSLEES